MANHSRWTDAKGKRSAASTETRASIQRDLALGQLEQDFGDGTVRRRGTLLQTRHVSRPEVVANDRI